MIRNCFMLVTLWFSVGVGVAQEPKKMPPVEGLPAPKRVEVRPIDSPDYIVGGPLPRVGTREVWQYYGVNRFGRFVPRVIVTPDATFYYRSGVPYPWMQSRPGQVMPTVLD